MIDKCPDRSPLIVAKTLKNIVTGKSICDIGCRNGDFLLELKKWGAKSIIGVECNEDRVKVCQQVGLPVVHLKVDPEEKGDIKGLPKAEIYYIWVDIKYNEKIANRIRNAIVILGGDPSVGEVYNIADGGKVTIPYDEGEGIRQKGTFIVTIIDKRDR